ncbi:ABC transporter substrate-binding protein [Bordetella genomosp. 11]|nr:ABC transporter substrate-binding protein [Bordetella genomosp. 11]
MRITIEHAEMTPGFQEEKPTAMSVFFRRAAWCGRLLPRAARVLAGCAILLAACVLFAHAAPVLAAGAAKPSRTAAAPPVPPALRIGEINTCKTLPGFSEPYRRGWMLALAQINAEGGVLGRKLEIRSREDHGDPDEAVRAAQTLVEKDGVVALFGGYSSEVGMALSRYADSGKVLYLAVAPLTQRLTWQEGNRYTFRLRPAAWMQAAAVAPKALGLRKLRWALVYQDTESDRAVAEAFKGLVKTFQSKTEFVDELAVPAGKFDAAATVAALSAARPEAIFNTLTGAQLASLARAGLAAHLFDGVGVVSLSLGDPENLDALNDTDAAMPDAPSPGSMLPDGWIITGYPRDTVDTPENQAFVQAYRDRYGDAPGMAAVLGYSALRSIAEGLKRAGSADREALAAAFPRLQVPTPFGNIEYRNLDHQATLGVYLGYSGHADGHIVMERFVYTTGARLQPLDEQIRRLRVQAARANAAHADSGPDGPNGSKTSNGSNASNGSNVNGSNGSAASPPPVSGPPANAAAAVPPHSASDSAHPISGSSRPMARPDTDLTARLRGARPAKATSPAPAAIVAPAPADSHIAHPGAPVRAARPGVETSAPALADWPDKVDQGAAGTH